MQAIYLFDYSKISEDYADYVFNIITQALKTSTGFCRFNHGDDLNGNAKNLAAHSRSHNGRMLQASILTDVTPLTDSNAKFAGGVYFVGLCTDQAVNIDTLHQAFNQPDIEGYIGVIEFREPEFDPESWNHFMRRQLHLPPKMELCNGERYA